VQESKKGIYKMAVASVYPLYLQKVQRKGRTKDELDQVIFWLTGYDLQSLQVQLNMQVDFEMFFDQAPTFHPNAGNIKGVICGYSVEKIEDSLMQKIRYLDKLVDELVKGKPLQKILRS